MGRWEKVRLGDVFTITSGGTPNRKRPEYFIGSIPWVKTGDLKTKYINKPEECISQEALDNSSAKVFPENTVLVALYGATIGACGILHINAATNQACGALLPSERVVPEFLYYFLCFERPKFVAQGVGGAQPNISGSLLKSSYFPLPPLEEQSRIVSRLDLAQKLIDQRKEQLVLMDQLVQSLFYEMFGDPVKNEKGWKKVALIDCCSSKDDIKCGPFGTQLQVSEFRKSGVPLWGIRHVNRDFSIPTVEFLDEKKAEELSSYSIIGGDLVMTRKGTIGNCAVYPFHFSLGIMHSDVLRLRLNIDSCLPIFMKNQFHYSKDLEYQLSSISQGAIMAGINVGKLKNLSVLLPPLPLQQIFANRVQQIEALKQSMTASLRELEQNFNALMQEAFGT